MYRKNLFYLFICLVLSGFAACKSAPSEKLSFAFLTDLHVQPSAESSQQLRQIVEEINQSDIDFVIVAGDISNQGSDEELLNVMMILDQLSVPYYIIPGNHEMNWSESAGQTFKELWTDDKFLFRRGDFLFVGLNTGPYMRMGDGHIPEEDIRWLQRKLEQHAKPGDLLLFFAHYPLAEGLDQWYRITDILKPYAPVVAFCGHGHRQQLMNFDGIPGIMGRSMVLRGENTPGYNLVKLRNDSLIAFEKETGKALPEAGIVFSLKHPHLPPTLPVSERPDFSVNDAYPFVAVAFQYADTSSVFTAPLLVGDSLVVFGNATGMLKALRIADASVAWEQQLAGPLFAGPALADGRIFMGDARGVMRALEAHTGVIIWERALTAPIVAPAHAEKNKVYAGVAGRGMYCLDAETGDIIWLFSQVGGLIQTVPVISGDQLLFTAWDTHLYCLDKASGLLLWKWNNQRPVALLSPGNVVPVVAGNKVFLAAPDRFLTALDLRTGREIWRSARHQVRESIGLSRDGLMLLAKTMNDTLISVCTKSEQIKTLWATDAGFGYDHNPIPIVSTPQQIFSATRNGLIMSVSPSGELLWKHKVGNSAVNFMVSDEQNRLWLTTANGQVFALKYQAD